LTSPIPLSNAAINHLIQLPHLRTLHVRGPPPNYPALSVPLNFPPLMNLTLGEGAAHGWLSLFQRLEDRASATQGGTPLSRIRKSLRYLSVNSHSGLVIDTSFVSLVQRFQNMVDLDIDAHCYDENDEGQCTFKLNNNDVTGIAMALPRLESLALGHPCSENTCATTIACLLLISVHCPKLEQLEIHFNTTNIVDDFKNISADPRFQQLRLLPRCPLWNLDVFDMPLVLDESDFETVVLGMMDIFPSLDYCNGLGDTWEEVFMEFGEL